MTDDELKELVASLAIAQRETDRLLRETDRQLKESKLEVDRQFQEILNAGLYLGKIHNEQFKLATPHNFVPKCSSKVVN